MSSSSAIELEAPAKLNLCLEVCGRRPDGYHEIDTVLAEIDLVDTVFLERASSISLEVDGGEAPADASNLAWRAAEALGVGARIRLVKRIPAGAGLGGGSSDAAAVLRGLDRLYGLGLDASALQERALGLGADVAFFLHGGTARCTGIGEVVEPLEGGGGRRFWLLLTGIPMATSRVYGAIPPGLTGSSEIATFFLRRYLRREGPGQAPHSNRLQAVAEGLDPRLREIREKAEEVVGAAFTMTGSGSAYFAAEQAGKQPHEGTFAAGGVTVRLVPVQTRERTG